MDMNGRQVDLETLGPVVAPAQGVSRPGGHSA